MLIVSVALALAAPTLDVQGPMLAGHTVTVTLTDLVPGEHVVLGYSDTPGQTCPRAVAPHCVDLASPRLAVRGTPTSDSASFSWTLPADAVGAELQAISSYGTSRPVRLEAEVELEEEEGGYIEFIGVDLQCNGDDVSLLVEYLGVADEVTAHAYQGGVLIGSHTVPVIEALSDDVTGVASVDLVVVDCADVTFVYEATSGASSACLLDGDEDLQGTDYAECPVW